MKDLNANARVYFPREVIFEILSWTKVATLLRFKCICKEWNEMIQDCKFIDTHMIRAGNHFYYQNRDANSEEKFKWVDSLHGLVLEQGKISGMYHVRNPTTKHILDIPDPKEVDLGMNLCYISASYTYKLVSVYYNSKIEICCKIMNLGGGNDHLTWRLLENSYVDMHPRRIISMMLIGEIVYHIGISMDGSTDHQIMFVNANTEVFEGGPISSVPKISFPSWENVHAMQWEDENLALGSIVGEEVHFWVLEIRKEQKLAGKEKIVIPLTKLLKENPDLCRLKMKGRLTPLWASSEIVGFTEDHDQMVVYDRKLGKVWRTHYAYPEKVIVYSAAQSLVTLKGMQPEKKEAAAIISEKITWCLN